MIGLLIFGVAVIVVLFVINLIGNAQDQIRDDYAIVNVVFIILTVAVLYIGMMIQIEIAEDNIKQVMLDGNWEVRTRTSVTLNDNGDTIKVDETKYIHILEKE